MINTEGELLNSKTEWHQPKIVRTTIFTGGAELDGGRVLPSHLDVSQSTQGTRAPVPAIPVDGLLTIQCSPKKISQKKKWPVM